MLLEQKTIVVTGGAHGIGEALCRRFAAEKASRIVVADIDFDAALRVAHEIGGTPLRVDMADPDKVTELVAEVERQCGSIDLFCSNAGIGTAGGPDAPDEEWERSWRVNVMAHVYAARAVLPGMLRRGGGYLLQTVSAAGLLTQIGSAPYAVTKHAALGFAEWLSVTYGDRGIRVSALCPMGVTTDMLARADFGNAEFLRKTAITPEQVAEAVVKGLEAERFLILPHPEVAEFFQRKAGDYDRWLRGMRRLQAEIDKGVGA